MQQDRSWEKLSKEEKRPIDLVLEGGGVKGIGLVGAISVLEEEGYQFQNIAGTSAGAIVAALIGAGYTADELRHILLELDFEMFKDEDAVDRIPLVGEALSILFEKGIYEGDHFQEWMREMLRRKLFGEKEISASPTFGELPQAQSTNSDFEHRIQVVTSDLTKRDLLVLPKQAENLGVSPDDLAIATAVRMSMSIPIFFEPVWFPEETEGDRHLLVDGGVLSNFPVWLFDVPVGEEPRWPTFGLRLFESPEKLLTDDLPLISERALADESFTIIDYLKDLVATMLAAHDRLALRRADNVRTIDIPALGIGTTQFSLSREQKDNLYKAGRQAARDFLEQFDYEKHIMVRREQGVL